MQMKRIEYRGGIASFELPSHWREEHAVEGGATFYDERPDSGTLGTEKVSGTFFDGLTGLR
jgi:hypothetical protein